MPLPSSPNASSHNCFCVFLLKVQIIIVCIPLAVESYGCWGMEAQESFKRLAARLAIQMGCSRSQATTTLYQRLSLSLVRANARALLSRARVHLEEGG